MHGTVDREHRRTEREDWLDLYSCLAFFAGSSSFPHSDLLFDHSSSHPADGPERLLQALWNEGRLSHHSKLRLEDGRDLEIIHPGHWNTKAGPDFRDAVLRLAGKTTRGDIEVHRKPADWLAHGHSLDQRYDKVVLHVVWHLPGNVSHDLRPPCLAMSKYFSPLWLQLINEISEHGYPESRQVAPGLCALQAATLDESVVRDFLTGAGQSRFRRKSRKLLDRGLQVGFDQTAYEGFWEALGYTANQAPFKALARQLPLTQLQKIKDPLTRLAALMGSAGFLVDPTRTATAIDPELHKFNRNLWDRWWRQGLPAGPGGWRKYGMRPANRPDRRLPVGWILLEQWRMQPVAAWSRELTTELKPRAVLQQLKKLFEFPCNHNLIHGLALSQARVARLGRMRILDIAVNLLLPLLHAKACHEQDKEGCRWAEETFINLPRTQENQVERQTALKLLFPLGRSREVITGAAQQQGLLAVAHDFCRPMEGNCGACPLNQHGMLVKTMALN